MRRAPILSMISCLRNNTVLNSPIGFEILRAISNIIARPEMTVRDLTLNALTRCFSLFSPSIMALGEKANVVWLSAGGLSRCPRLVYM